MINFERNSVILREFLMSSYGKFFPGCVFYITKNGLPFADGSFGWARMPGSPEGESPMTKRTLMHTGSTGKVFGALAIIKMVEEWNEMHTQLQSNPNYTPPYPAEIPFRNFVKNFGAAITLDTPFWPLIQPYLDQTLIAGYTSSGAVYPGANIQNITIRQLINHVSGIVSDINLADIGTATWKQVMYEPSNGGMAVFNHKIFVTALLKLDATAPKDYENNNYSIISAIIESVTGRKFADYTIQRLFRSDSAFSDLNRKVIDPSRGARYYSWMSDYSFTGKVLHPDYTNFSGAGGWYMSAEQFCLWFDRIMNKIPIGNSLFPYVFNLDHESFKNNDFKAFAHGETGRLKYLGKNGGAGVGWGAANADFRYYWGYNDERYCVFTAVNANVDASMLIEQGVNVLKKSMTKKPGSLPLSGLGLRKGLIQTVFTNSLTLSQKCVSEIKEVTVQNYDIDGSSAPRTNLFGSGMLPGSLSSSHVCMMELRGMLRIPLQGYYKFRLSSDDGSILWIDDDLLIDFNAGHAVFPVESSPVYLQGQGNYYPIRVEWYNGGGGGLLFLEWKKPNSTAYEAIPPENFLAG